MAVTLTIPAARGAPPRGLELRPRHFRAWVETLPLAHPMTAARMLRDHTAAMNVSRVDSEDRVQILRHCDPVAEVLLDELDALCAKSAVPLAPRALEALLLARALARELATGYAVAASERMGRLFVLGSRKHIPPMLYRSLRYLSSMLRASYKAYAPVPGGLWRRLHESYLCAEAEGLAAEPANSQCPSTIAQLYAETLLLALADPYRLATGDADRIVARIRGLRVPPSLAQWRPQAPAAGHFLVPCDCDSPPRPVTCANDERAGPNWRLLTTHVLVEKLRARQAAFRRAQASLSPQRPGSADDAALDARLIELWGDRPRRATRREAVEASAAICVGLKALSHYVSLDPRQGAQREADAMRRGITTPLVTPLHDSASRDFPVNEWRIVDQSRNGMRAMRSSSATQPVTVGDVIGVRGPGDARWSVGVVRWLRSLEPCGVECGIQFLAQCARAVSIRPTIASVANRARQALVLAHGAPSDQRETLLTPPSTFSDLREFEVGDGAHASLVRATTLLEKTGRFERFAFAPSGDQPGRGPAAAS